MNSIIVIHIRIYDSLYLSPAVVEELYLDVPTERDWLGQHQVNNGVRFFKVLVHFGGVNLNSIQ